jgi:hypothetical protein
MSALSSLLPRTIAWRRVLDDLSFEILRLGVADDGFRFEGAVVAAEDGLPLHVEYRIECDAKWCTKSCFIDQDFDGRHERLVLSRDADSWLVNGAVASSLSGCMDVDLGISPSTNTLPINRLRLGVGAGETIRAAWVRFPAMRVEAAPQPYERLSGRRYLYRNLGGDFRAELEIDEVGLVSDYEKIWKRIAVSRPANTTP